MVIRVVASTNVYGDVIAQLGGARISVTSILDDPNTDPHSYESSTRDAAAVAGAALIVQNGIGYDGFMGKLEGASPDARRVVLDVGASLGYKDGDNPHLWYDPSVMPRVAALVVADLTRADPAGKAAFAANLKAFDASLGAWTARLAAVKRRFAGTPVAVTEPVFDYALQAMGLRILTPYPFQAAIMGGTDPAPQDVAFQQGLFNARKVKLFCYNQQAVAPITRTLLDLAHRNRVPVLGVYETKPAPRNFQRWMVAEADAVDLALTRGISTEQIH